jgi:hypothetical protein
MCDDAVAAAPSISRRENANAARRLYLFCTRCQLFAIAMDNPAWYLSAILPPRHTMSHPHLFLAVHPMVTEGLSLGSVEGTGTNYALPTLAVLFLRYMEIAFSRPIGQLSSPLRSPIYTLVVCRAWLGSKYPGSGLGFRRLVLS